MSNVATEAAEAAAQATGSAEVKKPQPLSTSERVVAALLVIAGLVLIGVTLYAFSSTDSNFTFKAKEKVSKESVSSTRGGGSKAKSGRSAKTKHRKQGKKQGKEHKKNQNKKKVGGQKATPVAKETREVDYADTVVIFALTIGAALTLAGGFYGRLRSLKLGALELGFVSDEAKKAATDSAAEKVAEKVTDPAKQDVAKAAAQQVAIADLTKAVAMGVQPTPPVIEGIADQAAEKVAEAIK